MSEEITQDALLDRIGPWSELKLAILKDYAKAYSKIMAAQTPHFCHHYIDAFAGAGLHISRETGGYVSGSPLNALQAQPPFSKYHLIDADGRRIELLRELTEGMSNVHLYEGDCNEILLNEVFPHIPWEKFCRALCFLDPYRFNVRWEVLEAAGRARTIDLFLNFMISDMNRNVLRRDPSSVSPAEIEHMNRFWGDGSWKEAAYTTLNLFGYDEKVGNDVFAEAFRNRLTEKAGFSHTATPLPLRNKTGGVVYYLFFASQKETAARIAGDIFGKYKQR